LRDQNADMVCSSYDGELFTSKRRVSSLSLSMPHSSSSDLDSIRRKLQRESLESGHKRVRIWDAALKVVYHSRILLAGPQVRPRASSSAASSFVLIPRTPFENGVNWIQSELSGLKLKGKQTQLPRAKPSIWNNIGEAKFHFDDDLETVPRIRARKPFSRDQVRLKIIQLAADPTLALHENQVMKAMEYGSDRKTLAEEREQRAKDRSHQIWWILESIGCLSYNI